MFDSHSVTLPSAYRFVPSPSIIASQQRNTTLPNLDMCTLSSSLPRVFAMRHLGLDVGLPPC